MQVRTHVHANAIAHVHTRVHTHAHTCSHTRVHAEVATPQHGPGSRRCPLPGCDAVRQSRVAPVGRPGEGRVGPPCPFCIFPPIFHYRRERQKRPSRGTAGRTPPAQGAAASWARARRSGCGGRGSSRRPAGPGRTQAASRNTRPLRVRPAPTPSPRRRWSGATCSGEGQATSSLRPGRMDELLRW